MKTAASITDYFSNCTSAEQAEFERIRGIVKKVAPEAEETISYGMPAFKVNKKPLIYFGVFADHLSLFPTAAPLARLKEKLKPYKTGKGTIQFTLDRPIPEELIVELLEQRLADIKK